MKAGARAAACVAFAACVLCFWSVSTSGRDAEVPVGIFESSGDVGAVLHKGSVKYDAADKTYTITGSGENMWLGKDEFQFAWKKMSGDVAITADIHFLGKGTNPHRKAVLMIRQSLDTDAKYADVALHGVGLTSLQYRHEAGEMTHEIESAISAPQRVRIEKHGDYFSMWLGDSSSAPQFSAGMIKVSLTGPFYVGIGVCSHEKDLTETAVFSNVSVEALKPAPVISENVESQSTLYSTLETMVADSVGIRTEAYATKGRIEAPNWTRDGKTLLFNRNGRIEHIAVTGGTPETIDTGFATRCNNDHGISPDSKELAISDNSQEDHESLVYIVPFAGGTPRRITQKSPSYWHGWSPDGKTLAFVGQRNGEFDIYTIPEAGGTETRLTTAPGLDDGPEYSPDGKYIYFNSERTGNMQIWRMNADGSEQTQITHDVYNNWFPHISPDGTQMVMITFDTGVKGHPPNKDVTLRLMSLKDGKITELAKLFGGQGTINVPSWSPDGKRFAFVSYALIPKAQ